MGLTILQDPPGTGQTSHLRYLVHELRSAHRFYYLPVTVYPILASPTAVDLWASENEKHKKKIGINRGRRNSSHGESVGQSTVAFQSAEYYRRVSWGSSEAARHLQDQCADRKRPSRDPTL